MIALRSALVASSFSTFAEAMLALVPHYASSLCTGVALTRMLSEDEVVEVDVGGIGATGAAGAA